MGCALMSERGSAFLTESEKQSWAFCIRILRTMRFFTSVLCLFCLLGLLEVNGLVLMEDEGEELEERDLSKAILEMLHIRKLSAPQQAKPHPYMRHVYQAVDAHVREVTGADGTLVQSFRSTEDSKYGTPGWIWFDLSQLSPFMRLAELVLLRKTLHPKPLSVTVTVHSLSPGRDHLSVSGPLVQHTLSLDRLPPSGYDVFNVTAALAQPRHPSDILGFQLRFEDESGSLVLHEALTQSLYCLNTSSPSQPLLVAYRSHSMELRRDDSGGSPEHSLDRHRPSCSDAGQERQRVRNERHTTACRLHVHHVSLRSSTLNRWILQPASFNVSLCRGICLKQTPASSMTVHRQRKRQTDSLQRSSCTPEGLSPLLVMYRSDSADIVIKELRDVRAERCVCRPTAL